MTPEYNLLFNYLLNNYKYVEPETTYQWCGDRVVSSVINTKILCWEESNTKSDTTQSIQPPSLTVFIQRLSGSPDDTFEHKFIVFVNDKYVGMSGSEDGVFDLVSSVVLKDVDEC